MTIRKARISDVSKIQELINHYADRGQMLPRSINELYENIRDFWIEENNNVLIGCVALHPMWDDLGEIKSFAVKDEYRRRGIGKSLLEKCVADARQLEIKKIFALTYIPDYFRRFGFQELSKDKLPHKIWSECIRCPKFPDCGEIALLLELS